MSAVDRSHLETLYAETDDPWNFRTSDYEAEKFAATVAALPRAHYAHALELGCGNGELARRVSLFCAAYTGLDAVEVAVDAARVAVPRGRFVQGFLPCNLPAGFYDLIILSEVLYFLDAEGIAALSGVLNTCWPNADIVCVSWRGPSGNPLGGEEAFELFRAATRRPHFLVTLEQGYRIDLLSPLERRV